MKQTAEYLQHAAECRKLALGSKTEDERQQLLQMALAWEQMAEHRQRVITRERGDHSN